MKKFYFGYIVVASLAHYPLYAMMQKVLGRFARSSAPVPIPVTTTKAAATFERTAGTLEKEDTTSLVQAVSSLVDAATSAAQGSQRAAVPVIEKAVEKVRLLDKRVVRIENNTHDTVLLRIVIKSFGCCENTLMPGQFIDFPSIDEITLLEVRPYGVYKGWVSAETLRVKKLPNLVDFVKTEAKRLDTQRIKMSIHPYWDSSQSGRLAYPVALICERMLPYWYVCDYTEQLDEYSSLDEAFPQLARAVKDKRIDEPRLVLNTGLHHEHNVYNAYQHLYAQWLEKKASLDAETKKFATDVTAILQAAYLAIEDREKNLEAFKSLIQKHFIDERKAYSVLSNADSLLQEFLEERGREVLRPQDCDSTIKALKGLMATWPRFKAFMQTRLGIQAVIHKLSRKFGRGFPRVKQIDIVNITLALETPEARDWLAYKFSLIKHDAPRNLEDFEVIHKILFGFDNPFYKPLVDELVKQKASLNVVDQHRNTILMRAIIEVNFDLALFLMGYSVGCFRPNYEGKTPLQLAQEKQQALNNTYNVPPAVMQKCAKLIELLKQRLEPTVSP